MDNDKIVISMDGFDPSAIPGSRRVANPTPQPTRGKTSDGGQRPQQPRRKAAVPPAGRAAGKDKRRRADGRPGWVRFLADRRTHRAAGVVLVVLAAVVLIVTLSHLRNGAVDQSAVENASVAQMAEAGIKVENAGGPFGAKLSQWLFADGLGLGAFIVVVWLAMVGVGLLKLIKLRFWSLTAKCLFSAITVSVVAGLLFYNSESYIHWGGSHGHYVNAWLMSMGNALLAVAVSVCLLGVLACIYLNELSAAYRRVSGTVARKREEWRAARQRERERRALMSEPEPEQEADYDEPDGVSLPEMEEEPSERSAEPVRRVVTSGFDIDDEIEGEGEYTLRTRPAEDEPVGETTDYRQEHVADEPHIAGCDLPSDDETDAPDGAAVGGTEFVVRATGSDEESGFSIDDDDVSDDETVSAQVETVDDDSHAGELYDPRAELSRYRFPEVDLLIARDGAPVVDMEEQRANKDLIVKTLLDYKIPTERIEATVGPTVTLYEVKPAEGVRIAQIKRLEDDIALSLSALGIRIIAPIPGKDVVGIEVPNRDPQIVSIRNVFASRKFRECNMRLPMAMGATISNDIFIADLAKMPHLLVAGATGQGKSVGLNCILASLLYKKHPGELKFVLIDPKMVEFSLYSKLERHYIAKLPDEEEAIVTDPLKAAATLHSLCIEMDNRYQLLREAQVRNIEEYNDKFVQRRLNPERGHRFMPYIVMVVDEFADLIMQAGKEVSLSIARIAQKARAVGMHMIIATQRPSTDVISGMIKNNFPGRIAFKVSQMVDSRTILDSPGANRLIGRGDMLFSHNSAMTRVQCALIETSEVEAIVDHINDQIGYPHAYLLPEIPQEAAGSVESGLVDLSKRDAMFDQCARFIVTQSTASTSMLQRRFGIGYNKAGKIMDQMEAAGIVGPACGAKPRAILVDGITVESIINNA